MVFFFQRGRTFGRRRPRARSPWLGKEQSHLEKSKQAQQTAWTPHKTAELAVLTQIALRLYGDVKPNFFAKRLRRHLPASTQCGAQLGVCKNKLSPLECAMSTAELLIPKGATATVMKNIAMITVWIMVVAEPIYL